MRHDIWTSLFFLSSISFFLYCILASLLSFSYHSCPSSYVMWAQELCLEIGFFLILFFFFYFWAFLNNFSLLISLSFFLISSTFLLLIMFLAPSTQCFPNSASFFFLSFGTYLFHAFFALYPKANNFKIKQIGYLNECHWRNTKLPCALCTVLQ